MRKPCKTVVNKRGRGIEKKSEHDEEKKKKRKEW
jgi:hypothetical protein